MRLLLLAGAVALAGCVTMGKPFESSKVTGIALGKTTQADLRATFGEPARHGIDDGDQTWTYLHYQLKLWGRKLAKDLYIRFNADGTVRTYSFNTNYPGDEVKPSPAPAPSK